MHRWPSRRAPRLIAVVAIALHAGCASPGGVPDTATPSPSVWRAQRPDTGPVFLMGSVHLGKPAPLDLGPVLAEAWQHADELVLEVDLSLYGEDDGRELAGRYGRVVTPDTLRDRVAAKTFALLERYLEARGLPEEVFLPYQPWFVATAITVIELQRLGYDPQYGVDRVLLGRATGQKPIVGLETLESQFALLSALPATVQDLMLRDMLDRSRDFASEATEMMSAWRYGDDAALADIVFRQIDQAEFAPFYESILFGRNRRMADQIALLAKDGRTRLMVVGVGHMLGDRGIPTLLRGLGFEVEKLEQPHR